MASKKETRETRMRCKTDMFWRWSRLVSLNIFDQSILVLLSPLPRALCLIAERSAISATLMSEVSGLGDGGYR